MAHWFQPAARRWALPSSSHKLSEAQTHRLGTLTYSLSSGITTKTDPNHALPPLPLVSVPGAGGGWAEKSLTEAEQGGAGRDSLAAAKAKMTMKNKDLPAGGQAQITVPHGFWGAGNPTEQSLPNSEDPAVLPTPIHSTRLPFSWAVTPLVRPIL